MATHSGILAWRTSWTVEPRGLQSIGWQKVRQGLKRLGTRTRKEQRGHQLSVGLLCTGCLLWPLSPGITITVNGSRLFFLARRNHFIIFHDSESWVRVSNWPSLYHLPVSVWVMKPQFSSVQSLSHVRLFWLHESQHARLPCPSPTPGVHSDSCPSSLWCHPIISSSVVPFFSCPQSLPASGSFPIESTLHMRWPKYWSFSLSISPSNEHPGLISFRMDWLDLLAVQATCKSLLQHHSSKASILRRSAFFTVQLSHPYMTTGKIIALTRWTFVGNIMSLLFNILSRLAITFLPSSKCLLISWLQSSSALTLEPPK